MSTENLSSEEIRNWDSFIKAREIQNKSVFPHYGSIENLTAEEVRDLEAQVRTKGTEIRPVFQHYGSVENLSEDELRILQAQVEERRREDIPYREYLNGLVANPNISDNQQFENAVIRSMQSNDLMKEFTSGLVREVFKTIQEFKHIEKTDMVNIQNKKQKIEKLINVYVKYLYELRNRGWTFYGSGHDISIEMINRDILDNLWQIQKQFDITFDMPIPKDLGEYYGQAFERKGKMVPAISLMYDDLRNKEVNWHQVLIYKENELTPRQRYMQRKEEAVKQFDLARQEELEKALAYSSTQNHQINNNSVPNIEMQDQVDAPSVRR